MMKIRIAVATSNVPADREHLVELVEGLEKRRFDTLWLSDTPLTPAIEPLLALAVASAHTERLKLGTNVVVPGRNPLQLAKELAHLDRLSGGRLLIAFMPGIGSKKERAALGATGVDRIDRIEGVIELCRSWWDGQAVTDTIDGFRYDEVTVGPTPIQQPLEIWLGGNGPKGLRSTGTHGDGWLGSRATPAQAGANRATIMQIAGEAGRTIDDDHFGISIPYARSEVDDAMISALLRRTEAGTKRSDILPIGNVELQDLLNRHIDAGMSKFVLRPLAVTEGWDTELDFLAEHALPLQN
jgi:probable F420-dependent oxidoreductase